MIADWKTRERLERWHEAYKIFRLVDRETASKTTVLAARSDFESGYLEMLQELRARAEHDRILLIETAAGLLASTRAFSEDEEACEQAVRMARLLITTVDKPEGA